MKGDDCVITSTTGADEGAVDEGAEDIESS